VDRDYNAAMKTLTRPSGWLLAAALVLGAQLALPSHAAQAPYDEQADAASDLRHALAAARRDHKQVLVVFGANWCPDCRALDQALHGSSRKLINERFDVVKIDVGNFDKHLDLANRYDNPIKMGIPAVVVLDAQNRILYSTKGGELANARRMGENGIYDFLSRNVAKSSAAGAN